MIGRFPALFKTVEKYKLRKGKANLRHENSFTTLGIYKIVRMRVNKMPLAHCFFFL